MSSLAKKWALRSLIAFAALIVLLVIAIVMIVGSESGTRWMLGRLSMFTPVTIATEQVRGTLLTELDIPSVRYGDADRDVVISDLLLHIDWARSSLSEIVVERLVVRDVTVRNARRAPAEPVPLEIAIPALPVTLRADAISLQTLRVDDTRISELSVMALATDGRRLNAASAAAAVGAFSISVTELAGELAGDVPIAATIDWRVADSPWSGRAVVSGSLGRLELEHHLAGDFPADTRGTLALLHRTEPLADLDTRFDAWRYRDFTVSDGALRITGTADHYESDLSGKIRSDAELSADVSGSVSGNLRGLEQIDLIIATKVAQAHASGSIEWTPQLLADLVVEFDALQYRDFTVSDGVVRITGTADNYESNLSAGISSEKELSATVSGSVSGSLRGLERINLVIDSALTQARVTGGLEWAPQPAIDVLLVTEGLDPSTFVAVPPGVINSEVHITANSAEQFVVDVVSLTGRWNEQPLSGRGRASRQAESWRCAECLLNIGQNRIDIDVTRQGRALTGSVDIVAPDLHQIWPGLSGSLASDSSIRGSLALPILSGQVSGTDIVVSDWKVDSLLVRSQDSTFDNIDFAIDVAGLARADAPLGGGSVRLSGEPLSMVVAAEWALDGYSANADGQLAIEDETLHGTISTASVTEPFTGTWKTTEPMSFDYAPGRVRVENGSWQNGNAQLTHPKILIDNGLVTVNAALSNAPADAINAVLPESMRVTGLVNATADIVQTADGWSGTADWQLAETVVQFLPGQDDEFQMQIPVARATARLQRNSVDVLATINAEPGIQATLNLSVADLSRDAPLNARLQLGGDEWDWITALVPDIDNIEGNITSDIVASGRLASPDLSGEFRWTEGQLDIPALNLPLRKIDVSLTGTSAGDMTIAGNAISGNGPIRVSGRLDDVTSKSRSFSLQLQGNQADLLNWPGYQLVASPDLTFAGNFTGVKVSGRIDLDKAEIAVRELPEGAVRPSDDVSVAGRDEQARERTRYSGDVELVLSENIHIQAFGLDTNVEGQLRFVVPEAREPQAHGELRLVGGVFEAYGQRLEIEQGTMIFSGPLDDPLINVRAIRKIDGPEGTVTASLNLNGHARNLSSSVSADPAMSEAEALSYLVLGRPLEDASSADGSSLSNTAYSLGLRQAGLITNQIGQTVGLDELQVSGSNQNTTELVAGKRINSRLYARYAYGVFTRLGHLLLRYRISNSFSIEVGAGQTQSMDIMYTIERE